MCLIKKNTHYVCKNAQFKVANQKILLFFQMSNRKENSCLHLIDFINKKQF